MAEIIAERMTAAPDGEVVVFLIGMRINRFWKLRKWLPVAFAMPRMLRELERSPDVGFLGFHRIGNPTITLQYRRSFEHLEQYAKDAARLHRTAWAPFNHAVGKSGDVGVWHATYRVRPGDVECIYNNMRRSHTLRRAVQLPRLLCRREEICVFQDECT